jgi:hypothetical protein
MPSQLPRFELTHGQVAWALSEGLRPSRRLLDELRYLRQLGVPFETSERGKGRGNPLHYDYDHLLEVGVAQFATRRGLRPREVASFLVENRDALRPIYRQVFCDQPQAAIEEEWVTSRGRMVPFLADELFLRLHDRYSDSSGKIDILNQDEVSSILPLGALVERFPGGETRTLLPLTRLALQLVAWARCAPEIRPGRT